MDGGNCTYQFVAGNLALDFVNTVAFRADPVKRKTICNVPRMCAGWLVKAQLRDRAAINSGPPGDRGAAAHPSSP
jgi:hypothetical protein